MNKYYEMVDTDFDWNGRSFWYRADVWIDTEGFAEVLLTEVCEYIERDGEMKEYNIDLNNLALLCKEAIEENATEVAQEQKGDGEDA